MSYSIIGRSGVVNSIIQKLPKFKNTLQFIRFTSNSSAYEGDGKTTVRVLNHEESNLHLVNTYSHKGFRLSNNLFVAGSILLFPTHVYSWNVRRGIDITPESLILFDLIVPKVKIIIIGYGQQGEPFDASIPLKLKKKGISCEMLTTPNAVTTYNYLVADSVHVAGAFVPVKDDVNMTSRDVKGIRQYQEVFGDEDYLPLSDPKADREPREYKEIYRNIGDRDKGKTKFEE